MGDAIFEDPRLAEIYDFVDDDRSDLDVYAALTYELAAQSVLDVGCGTGTFACILAAKGKDVTAIDPAAASLAVAQRKPHADRVQWIEAKASDLPRVRVDLVTMTGNVAQVFLLDNEWHRVLGAARAALVPGGYLVFETRRPERRVWEGWTRQATHRRIPLGGDRWVDTCIEVTEVNPPLVSFRQTFAFEPDGTVLTSDSTLRFRTQDEVEQDLERAGFRVQDVRDAPDRSGLEFVFIAKR